MFISDVLQGSCMERRILSIDDLILWQDNPRVEHAQSQYDEIANIYDMGSTASQKTSHRQLMNLAESIAENGYQNTVEPILVTQTEQGYVVRDANRRISCIKILNNPQKYRNILEDKDYKRIEQLVEENKTHIPNKLEVVVFQDDEEEEKKLREILARKHNGSLDGAGTVEWDSRAKDRFFQRNQTFTDKLEKPFESQFGESLTSYLGGSNAITSTRRVFDAQPIRKYLDIKDEENITPVELDKVKKLADEVKDYSKQHNILISRFHKENLVDLLEGLEFSQAGVTPGIMDFAYLNSREGKEFIKKRIVSSDRNLGSLWLDGADVDFNNKNFENINTMLIALQRFGDVSGDEDNRHLKMWLLAPCIRVFFEMSLRGLADSNLNGFTLPNGSVSKEHRKNVQYVHGLWKKDLCFSTWLADNKKLFSSFNEAKSIINTTDFAQIAEKSNLSSHSSMKTLDEADLRNMFNVAVLFSILSEQYVVYKEN